MPFFSVRSLKHSSGPPVAQFNVLHVGSKNKHADYAALFLQIIGVYAGAPCLSTWNSNNVQPHYRRATAIAAAFASTNIGGTYNSFISSRAVKLTSLNLDRHRLYMDIYRSTPLSHCHQHKPRLFPSYGCSLRVHHGISTLRQQKKTEGGGEAGEGIAEEWGLGVGREEGEEEVGGSASEVCVYDLNCGINNALLRKLKIRRAGLLLQSFGWCLCGKMRQCSRSALGDALIEQSKKFSGCRSVDMGLVWVEARYLKKHHYPDSEEIYDREKPRVISFKASS